MVGWNTIGFAAPSSVADGSDIAAVSRFSGHMEIFFIAPDGSVTDYYWYGSWGHYTLSPPGTAAAGGITALSRGPAFIEAWWVGPMGSVEGSFYVDGKKFINYQLAPPGQAAPGCKIRAVSKAVGHMEVWWISPSGSVEGCFWYDDGKAWRRYQLAPPGSAHTHSGLTAVSREPKAMEVWWVSPDGRVDGAWAYDKPVWTRYELAPAGSAVVGGGLRAQSRLSNILNVFWISPAGSVEGCVEVIGEQPWTRYQIAGTGQASVFSGLFSLHRYSGTEEIFWISPSGTIMDAFWYESVNKPDPWQVFPAGGNAKHNSSIAGVSREPGTMETWFAGPDGGLGDRYWYDFRTKSFSKPITSGGLAALGGWATVTIKEDGTVRWQGDGHDSGADDYEYGVVAYLRPRPGGRTTTPIVLVHHGHVEGHIFGNSGRDDPWNVPVPPQDLVKEYYDEYDGGTLELDIEYTSGFLTTIEGIFNSAIKFAAGSLIDGIGILLFVGVEVGSFVSTGSLVAGARILNNILYMAGPGNTLLAMVAGGIAAVGSRSKMISAEDYEFVNEQVFRSAGSSIGTLPPRERIFITDTKGMDNRAFTLPMWNGNITVNVGGYPGMYDNPQSHADTLIHELTHAWQIAHTPMPLTLLAEALSNQLRGSTSYDYPPPGPAYKDLNTEQQAQIVEEWWTGINGHGPPPRGRRPEGGRSPANPYYRYIVENIQTGMYT